jgi:hypothetical protein
VSLALTLSCGARTGDDGDSPNEDPSARNEDSIAVQVLDFTACTGDSDEQSQHMLTIRDYETLELEFERRSELLGAADEPLPEVDFSKNAVLALYFGSGSCNNELTVTAEHDGATTRVHAALRLADDKCIAQPLSTYPYAFVVLPSAEDYQVTFGTNNFACDMNKPL